ncbi:hypothetical protein JCM17136A_00410 [Phocaeicola sartorii JCM 17136 = DSM 21941]
MGCKTTLPKKQQLVELRHPLAIRTLHTVNTILVKELLEVAAEVVVHRITQVGRIRAGYYTAMITNWILDIYMFCLMV